MTADLELRDIEHRYAGADQGTLHRISLAVDQGAMVAVVGPSGSGKSTLLRIAAGLTPPTAGEVLLDGTPVTHLPPEQRDLTVMFQQPHLFPHLDVRDNVAFAPRLAGGSRREARATARRYLDLVHLGDLAHRRPRELSGGQEQRVALARALASERGVMLLDEPFSSLDPELRRSMHSLLAEVRAAVAPTVLMVTHDLDEAALAEQVAVLVDGRIDQVAPVTVLYARPATLSVARLVGGFNEVDGVVVDGEHRSWWGAVRLPVDCASAGPATLLMRREHLDLTSQDDPRTSARGTVVSTAQAGARQVATVEMEATPGSGPAPRLQVELPLGETTLAGHPIGLALTEARAAWAVPCPSDSGAVPEVAPVG